MPEVPTKWSSGFSLIELMVVITIVGVLASIAYASYTGYTKYADRSQAQSDLYEIAQIMERGFTQTRNYATVDISMGAFNNVKYTFQVCSTNTDCPAIPTANAYAIVANIDVNQSTDDYDLSLDSIGFESYKLDGAGSWTSGWDIPD